MKIFTYLLFPLLLLTACNKNTTLTDAGQKPSTSCDMRAILTQNSSKVTITKGIWGTLSVIQGNCMPTTAQIATCSQCPIQREVRIYAYTTPANTTHSSTDPALYDSFTTPLITTVTTDANGFYQAALPDGQYTVVFVENGKLYSNVLDAQGGISSAVVLQNKVNINLTLNRAAF